MQQGKVEPAGIPAKQRRQEWQPLTKNQQIELDLAESPLSWQGDTVLLSRALDNLIGNAIRYARHRIRIRVLPDTTQACLCVEDDGPGIDSSLYDQIFEPFIRLDPSRDRQTGGYGLGLAIVDGVMRAHGGHVTLGRSPLGGACFTLCWPQNRSPY